jgi:hypothetical protein
VIALVKLALGLAPAVLTAAGWVVVRLRDRRKVKRSPELRAAIARHPSMHQRDHASYRTACCRSTITGIDPMDLLAKQLHHESVCLWSERAA